MHIVGSFILLTGATGGLGQAIARALAAKGAKLTLTGRNEHQLEALADEIGANLVVADLADRDDVSRLAELMADHDVLVANAGIGSDPDIGNVTVEGVDEAIDVNLRSPIVLATAFAQSHIEVERPGQIVMIGSLSGLAATPDSRMYNATKFGLRGYTLSLRQDLAPYGIGVTHVAPGVIRDAGMHHKGGARLPRRMRTKSPTDVGRGVVRAIEKQPAEVFVSPPELRLSSKFSTIAPALSERRRQILWRMGDRRARPGD